MGGVAAFVGGRCSCCRHADKGQEQPESLSGFQAVIRPSSQEAVSDPEGREWLVQDLRACRHGPSGHRREPAGMARY